jgi:predicted regulator of Ras-like GTPase activity (Roadblock/LC7/MglB family)
MVKSSGDTAMAGWQTWFRRLTENPHIEMALIADKQGRIVASSHSLSRDHERIASMLQSMEVLAQALAEEMTGGMAELVQISTSTYHIILLPLLSSTYFLVVQVKRSAPLTLLMIEIERVARQVREADFSAMSTRYQRLPDESPLNAAELIEAVQEWLHSRSS